MDPCWHRQCPESGPPRQDPCKPPHRKLDFVRLPFLTALVVCAACGTTDSTAPTVGPTPTQLGVTIQPTSVAAGVAMTPAVVVTVRDASGNTVTSSTASITLAITGGTGTAGAVLSGTVTQAAVSGVATFSDLKLDKVGTGYTLTATATGLTSATSSGFAVTAGAPTQMGFTVEPTSVAAGVAMTPAVVVTVRDASGNTVTSSTASITLAITGGTGTAGAVLSGTVTQAAVSGVATFSDLKLDKVGTGYTLTATATGLTSATSSGFAVTAGAPTQMGFTVEPTSVAAGVAMTPAVVVTVRDASGNTVTSSTASITLAITGGTGTAGAVLSGTVTQAAVSGVATFSDLKLDKVGTGYTLTATATGLTSATSSGFAVTAGAPTQMGFTVEPTSVAAGVAMTPAVVVTVRDASGNTVTSSTASITLAITGGTGTAGAVLSGTVTQAAVSGVATFSDLKLDKVGTGYTLTATATGLTSATSSGFAVTAGAPTQMGFTVEPTSVAAGVAMTPAVVVTVRDASGNTVTSSTASITLAITGGTGTAGAVLSGTVTQAAVSGVATFSDLKLDKVGTGYTLTATATGLTSATSSGFAVTAGAPTQMGFTVEPTSVAAGVAMTPAVVVTVRDASGNTVTSSTASITLAITGGTGTAGAVLSGTVTQAAVSGVATFSDLKLDKVGTGYTLTATATGLTSATSSGFAVTAGAPTQMGFTVEPTSVAAGVAMTPAVVVTVRDASGNTVTSSTASITLAITGGTGTAGAVLSGTVTQAAVSGVATFSDLKLDKVGTGYTLTATATGLTSATSSGFAVTVGTPTQMTKVAGDSQMVGAPGMHLAPMRVEVRDTFDNLVPGAAVVFRVTSGSGRFDGIDSTVAVTDASGEAGASIVLGPTDNETTVVRVAISGAPLDQVEFVAATVATQGNWLRAGSSVTCGIVVSAELYCWGYNGYGVFGNGSVSTLPAVTPVLAAGGLRFAAVTTPGSHVCGLAVDGGALCWGDNSKGQLGDGTTTSRPSPVPVAGGHYFRTIETSPGGQFSCGVTSRGEGYCWGRGLEGELGDAAQESRSLPSLVSGGLTFELIRASGVSACGLTVAGDVYCWGNNSSGQLGPGNGAFTDTPSRVLGLPSVVDIAFGGAHACVLTQAGGVLCWGANTNGELGDGTTISRDTPAVISSPLQFSQVSVGGWHSCAIAVSGEASCWGGPKGIGDGLGGWVYSPTPVAGGLQFATMSGGAGYTCGVTIAGFAYCWGANSNGELGTGSTFVALAPAGVVGSLSFKVP